MRAAYKAFHLFFRFLARGPSVGTLFNVGGVLVIATNLLFAYPALPCWARWEAVVLCLVMAVVVAIGAATIAQLLRQQARGIRPVW